MTYSFIVLKFLIYPEKEHKTYTINNPFVNLRKLMYEHKYRNIDVAKILAKYIC